MNMGARSGTARTATDPSNRENHEKSIPDLGRDAFEDGRGGSCLGHELGKEGWQSKGKGRKIKTQSTGPRI